MHNFFLPLTPYASGAASCLAWLVGSNSVGRLVHDGDGAASDSGSVVG